MVMIDSVSRAYIVAGLRLGNAIEGLVDDYHGPEELVDVAAGMSVDDALNDLEVAVEDVEPPSRRAYLGAQSRALRMVARVAAGESVPYRQQVAECFDIEPEWVDEGVFEAAHDMLDRLLPGSGSLATRRERYRTRFQIEPDQALRLTGDILADLRSRTANIVDLPDGESVELRLVSDQPWSGYNWYLGNLMSRIEINTDLPIHINDLPDLLAHEAYPGHHTEHMLHEQLHFRDRGYGEAAITLLITPQAVVSEGIATAAFDTVVPPTEQVGWLRDHAFAPAGIDEDIEQDLAIRQAARALSDVTGNAALLLHDRGSSVDEAVDYIMRFGLRSEGEARKSVQFLTHPLFRTYVYTYTSGYELVTGYLLGRGDRSAGFRTLLTEQWTPGRLRGSVDRQRSSDDERLPL